MDDDLREFVSTVADTDVKKELLLYFHQNPAIDTPQGLSMWINRSADEIAGEIDNLVDAAILRRSGSGPGATYRYAPSEAQRQRVDKFVAFYRSDRRAAEDELELLRRSLADIAQSSLREIQREQSKTKTILASMVDGVVVTDARNSIVLYNPAAARLLGLEGGIGLGRPLRECNDDPGVQQLARWADELLASDLTMIAQEIDLSHPRPICLKAHLSAVRDDQPGPVGVVTVLRDITEMKQLDEQRVAFIHMVSHELRSPLTSIKGFVQAMLKGVFGDLAADQKEPLEIVDQQSERLLAMINDLLEMARMDASRKEMKMEPVDLRALLDRITRLFTPQAREKNHTLCFEVPGSFPIINADPDAMEHVFTNLVSNAVKYTLPGGTIRVSGEDRGEFVAISVADTGIGIPPQDLPKLFSRFFRVKDPKTREVTGTGLGLAIVKNYVEAHMGTIDLETEVEVGTTFTVTLPKHLESRRPSEVESALQQLGAVHTLPM